jgi:hypothetical protein
LIQTWSGNEPWTREMADLSFARAMAVADTARRNRCVPILVTPAPVFGTNPEAEAHRQHNRTRGRAAAQAGGYLLDLDTLWGTGATPNTYRREYDWGDQMHPNDAACAAAARVLAPMLQQILGRL